MSELSERERGREGGRERELYLVFGQWPIIYMCTTLEYQQNNSFSIWTLIRISLNHLQCAWVYLEREREREPW